MKICVFGASSDLIDETYKTEAYNLGKTLAENGHSLVFGGGASGLMGAVARGFKAGNGYITSIAPKIFDSVDIIYQGSDEIIITETLIDRKEEMLKMSDCFISLAGGIGTYDELFEALSNKQLKYIDQPVIIYNTLGYYDNLVAFLNETHKRGFMDEKSLHLYEVFSTAKEVVDYLKGE